MDDAFSMATASKLCRDLILPDSEVLLAQFLRQCNFRVHHFGLQRDGVGAIRTARDLVVVACRGLATHLTLPQIRKKDCLLRVPSWLRGEIFRRNR